MKYIIGEDYHPNVLMSVVEVHMYSMMRTSDSYFWDFTNNLWTTTPVDKYSDPMTSNMNVPAMYTATLETDFITQDTEIIFIYSSTTFMATERVQFAKEDTLIVFPALVYNRDTEHTSITCIGKTKQSIILTPARVTFSILSHTGTVILDPIVVTSSVNGVLTTTTADFIPTEGTAYILEVIYEYDGHSYDAVLPFTVI